MIIAMTIPQLTKIGIFIDFKINQDFIAEVLCINKAKPITVCEGQCYLSEQLKKAEEQEEKQAPVNLKERLEVNYYYAYSSFDFFNTTGNDCGMLNTTYESGFFDASYIAEIFHPPQLS